VKSSGIVIIPERVPVSVNVYAFQALFFLDDDSGIDGAYKTFLDAADDCMLLEVNDTAVKIWVDPRFENSSEEPE
jgi:hypothetical protein